MMRMMKVVQSQPSLAAVEVIGPAIQSLDSLSICFFAGFKVWAEMVRFYFSYAQFKNKNGALITDYL